MVPLTPLMMLILDILDFKPESLERSCKKAYIFRVNERNSRSNSRVVVVVVVVEKTKTKTKTCKLKQRNLPKLFL